ncbi:SusC/RagA family TonB-linked outer membrane protein [Mariniphaga sediminis]|uniref:SusC/RagA family TonB-linked outer membrane protein n=1 Tax=Mariniphaga sediminis TaxID=1628158 RepID=A0A399CZW1_9BACT|nr:TonB-dependent receptor [Mariniphaga sediminis]RIH63630.1 SusC/RagA family TonB-linked outer membrane protein [Mariniphaga sediminis]
MKLTLLFSFLIFSAAWAESYSQTTRISLDLKNVPVKKLIQEIEDQTDFFFLYQDEVISRNQRITIQVDNESLDKIIQLMEEQASVSAEIMEKQIVLKRKVAATRLDTQQPERQITGFVSDQDGQPLPGVTVVVKGTTTGTVTNSDGEFTLAIPDNAETLQFSFVGMKVQEVAVEGKSTFTVVMEEDAIGVEEVVVVGYGTQKKVNLTGAVTAIKMDEKITSRSLPNVSSMMQGLVPGLAVNQNSGMAGNNEAELLIRGLGTVNNARPLVVVDGLPDVDLNRINMNDIESISVLKDAASSAVYGSRAANGVILITTKSGIKGETKINANVSYSVANPTKTYDFMADYPRALTLHQREAAVNTLRSNYTYKDGTIDQWMALGMIDPVRYPNTDWWNIILRNGETQNYNVSATGGNDKSNFFISVGLMDEKGLQISNDYTRYNVRINYDAKIRSNMNVGAKFAGNWSKYQYNYSEGFTANSSGSLDLYAAVAGILPYDPATGYYGGVMAYNENVQAYNPYVDFKNRVNYQNRQEANGSLYWDWSPVSGLKARAEYALNYYNQFRWRADIPARAYDFQQDDFGSRVYVGENAGVSNYSSSGYKTLLTGRINYDKQFGENHTINLMAVYSEEFWYGRSLNASRNDRIHPSLHELNAALLDKISNSGSSSAEGLRSYIGRLNYSAFDKYLLEANFRYDGSSKFLPGYQYGFFPSAAVGWRFVEEGFFQSIAEKVNLSNGKLRLSYGGLGNNSGVNRYEQQETLGTNNYFIKEKIVKGFIYEKMVNRDLSWEETRVINFGVDLGFWKNSLSLEIDYYNRLTTGMNRPSELSNLLTGAYDAPRRNIGDLRNRGIEGNFTWRDQKGAFNYAVNFNVSYNETVLEKWSEFLTRGWVFIDMPYHFLYTYEDDGIAQTWADIYNATPQGASPGDILKKDLNGDGRIDSNDRKAYPNVQRDRPTTNYALNANMSWKGFDLAILFQGAAGRKDYWINNYNNINFADTHYASTWEHWNNTWMVDNREGGWPRLGGSGNRVETTFWLDNLSYLRFKNLQLGYTFPQRLLKPFGISNIRVFGSAENLVTFTKYRGLDPEKRTYSNEVYPLNKVYLIGINFEI